MAYSIYGTCYEEVIDPACPVCAVDVEHGRVRSVAFIHSSVVDAIKADLPTVETSWTAAIAAKKVFIIPATQGSFDGGAPIETAGYGDLETRIVGYNFALQYKDPDYLGNVGFYNTIKESGNYYLAFRTEKLTRISDAPVTVLPKAPVSDDLNSEVVWDIEVKFTQPDHSVPFITPDDLFACPN